MDNIIRKILIFVCVIIATASSASAQFRYGFRLGASFADARLKNAPGYSLVNRSGFEGGIAFEYQHPSSGLAADIAILYNRYNVQLKAPDGATGSFGRNYLEIPLHVKYKFWLSSFHDLFAPLIQTGPSFLMRLDDNHGRAVSTNGIQPGWDVGVGIDIVNFIQITGGYRFALSNSVKSFTGCPDASIRSNGWNVAATILFDF